MKKKEKSIANV